MQDQNRYYFIFREIVIYTFFVITGLITILLLFCSVHVDYSYKELFGAENVWLLAGGILLGVLAIWMRTWKSLGRFLEKNSEKMILALTVILIFMQIYICYNAYFYTGWDVSVIMGGTFRLVEGKPFLEVSYFSRYPNNVFLLCLFSLIRKVDLYFGILDVQEGIMCLLCVQCLLSGITGYFLFQIIRKLTGYWSAWYGWFCYLVLVGTSGWLMIPYSDSTGLFFPITILYLYMKLQKGKGIRRRWFMIGALSWIGYCIKPQILITFIAIVLVELFARKEEFLGLKVPLLGLKRYKLLNRFRWIVYGAAGILCALFLQFCMVKDVAKQLDEERAFGISHYVMMGLNQVNNGGYLEEDVEFSMSFATKAERRKANMEVIGERLKDMGMSGLGIHIVKKLLTNYGDGTFAWEEEGNFFKHIYQQKNNFISPMLRNIIWGNGKANSFNETWKQCIWVCIITAALGMMGYRKKANCIVLVVCLSAVGLTFFELIFEARARYLYLYVPFYIIAGVLGAGQISSLILRKIQSLSASKRTT